MRRRPNTKAGDSSTGPISTNKPACPQKPKTKIGVEATPARKKQIFGHQNFGG
jgi:hypothetical protein